ncbi:metalloregulator ArsR/SmtB family transcription factor [Streptomyces sp. NPDC088360]|uniref:ArsR/SmtB family transcription factor n=1 Tax=unclassified Streptomyces TaxID=2593676 RepID=UPI0034509198
MIPIEALADPVRRRVLELLAAGEQPAGRISARVTQEFGISQPAASRHLRVLRAAGLVHCRAEGARRLYAVDPTGLREIDAWLRQFRGLWSQALSALETEVARGKHVADNPKEQHELR